MKLSSVICLAVIAFCGPLWADAPERSLRPSERLAEALSDTPGSQQHRLQIATQAPPLVNVAMLRPEPRPKLAQRARATARGSVCGVAEIKGKAIGSVPGPGACGISKAVQLSSVSGVALSQQPKIDCATAKALNIWVKSGLKPAVGKLGGGVKSLRVVAHYACRNRNSAKTGKLSEHAKGRAIDISAIGLNNGQSITVLKGWAHKQTGPVLKRAHKAACGPFGTVLGPEANKFHRDHFHFDTARYRSGSYCR